MASTLGNVAAPLGQFLISHTSSTIATNGEANVTGTAPTMYNCTITNNNSSAVYVKIHEATSVTPASHIPNFKLYAPASSTVSYVFSSGIGVLNGLSFWVTSTSASGATQGIPSDTVTVKIVAQ